MPRTFGYIRVNPLNIGIVKEFENLDVNETFKDSYDSIKPNKEFEKLIAIVEPKDKIIIESMSSVANSFFELNCFINFFKNQCITLYFHKEKILINANESDDFLNFLKGIVQFETDNIEKNKHVKLEKNKHRNFYKTKVPKVEYALLRKAMSIDGATYRQVAKQFNVGIATVQRAMKSSI